MNRFSDYLVYLQFLAYLVPVLFIYLSHQYKVKFNKLKGTGKVPTIICAQQRQALFFWLAIFSALVIILIQLPLFSYAEEQPW